MIQLYTYILRTYKITDKALTHGGGKKGNKNRGKRAAHAPPILQLNCHVIT